MSSEIITIYIPIFREKLARLETLGRGASREAAGLRRAIAKAENASLKAPKPDKQNARIPVAA